MPKFLICSRTHRFEALMYQLYTQYSCWNERFKRWGL